MKQTFLDSSTLPVSAPEPGQLVEVCQRQWTVFDVIFFEKCSVFAGDQVGTYATLLNASPVDAWVWKHSSRMKLALNFSAFCAVDTFPFPTPELLVSSDTQRCECLGAQRTRGRCGVSDRCQRTLQSLPQQGRRRCAHRAIVGDAPRDRHCRHFLLLVERPRPRAWLPDAAEPRGERPSPLHDLQYRADRGVAKLRGAKPTALSGRANRRLCCRAARVEGPRDVGPCRPG